MITTELEVVAHQEQDPIVAQHGANTVSERYGFISTQALLDNLHSIGFQTRSIQTARVRKPERKGFQNHVVRLRHESLLAPTKKGDVVPELVMSNSHDGWSSLRLNVGLYVMVCSNGLVVGEDIYSTRFIHRNISFEAVNTAAINLAQMVPMIGEQVERMKERTLTLGEKSNFFTEAAQLRFDTTKSPIAALVGSPRRSEDANSSLWSVYNRAQENLLMGTRGIRRITSAVRGVDLNKRLWNLAAQYLNN